MTFDEHAVRLTFASDRFDTTSELPPDANAGNRFYGRDVAELIAAGLDDASFLDEDWGWQVHATRGDGSLLEISVYYGIEEDDEWTLLVRSLVKRRPFGHREVEVDAAALSALERVFADAGIELRRESL